MIAHIITRYKKFLLALACVHFLFCAASTEQLKIDIVNNDGYRFMEIEESDSITLCWKTPLNTTDTIDHYELFYRTERETGWTLLKTNITTGINPAAVIHRSEMPPDDSTFLFAVRGVTTIGMKTDFHFSSDASAAPAGGWFLLWK